MALRIGALDGAVEGASVGRGTAVLTRLAGVADSLTGSSTCAVFEVDCRGEKSERGVDGFDGVLHGEIPRMHDVVCGVKTICKPANVGGTMTPSQI